MDPKNKLNFIQHHKRILRECEKHLADIRIEEKINKIRIRNAEAKLAVLRVYKAKRKKQICDLTKLIQETE